MEGFRVLVERYNGESHEAEPAAAVRRPGVQGVLARAVRFLSEDEREALRAAFPRLALDELWVLQAGRRPYTVEQCMIFKWAGSIPLGFALPIFLLSFRGPMSRF